MSADDSRRDLDAAVERAATTVDDRESRAVEAEIIRLRHEAAIGAIERSTAPAAADPPDDSVRFPGGEYPPAVGPDGLDHQALGAALQDAGCLHVPGLVPPTLIAGLIEAIDAAFDGFDDWVADEQRARRGPDDFGPWFRPYIPDAGMIHATRPWLRSGGGVFTADSPRLHRQWVDFLNESGIIGHVSEFFGEAPLTSLDKATIRRVAHGDGIEWHQDGSFIGPEAGALNLWLSLSDTVDSPGLEMVPMRLDHIVEVGTKGAGYDWSTGPGAVAEVAAGTGTTSPRFRPGDGLFFDGMLLHRSEFRDPPPPSTRYAIETWFFRPSRFPSQQEIPLAF